jgi:hypothetical protein
VCGPSNTRCATTISQPVTPDEATEDIHHVSSKADWMCIAHLRDPLRLIDAEADRAFCVASASSSTSFSLGRAAPARCMLQVAPERFISTHGHGGDG